MRVKKGMDVQEVGMRCMGSISPAYALLPVPCLLFQPHDIAHFDMTADSENGAIMGHFHGFV